jgi:hypothetical protein
MKIWSLSVLVTLFFACNQPAKQPVQDDNTAAGASFEPATPAGTISVSFPANPDTPQVKIRFEINGSTKEKTFDVPLAKDYSEEDLYRAVWDKPNSCYIGVLKDNRGTRYYHASVDGKDLKINQVGTPPAAVWQYAENEKGLGKMNTDLVDDYKQNLQSGTIIADFHVMIVPLSSPDSVGLYAEFGGANKTLRLEVPAEYKKGIAVSKAHPERCFLVLQKDNRQTNKVEVKVEKGHLQINTLN